MKEFINWYIEAGEQYWWAFAIISLLVVIIAHIPNVKDFHYWDLKIPAILLVVWCVLKLFTVLGLFS